MRLPSHTVLLIGLSFLLLYSRPLPLLLKRNRRKIHSTKRRKQPRLPKAPLLPRKSALRLRPRQANSQPRLRRKRVVLATPSSGSIPAPKFTITPAPPLTGRRSGACICARKHRRRRISRGQKREKVLVDVLIDKGVYPPRSRVGSTIFGHMALRHVAVGDFPHRRSPVFSPLQFQAQ